MKLIIIGCGRIGSELADEVCAAGHNVTVIDREPSAFERLSPDFSGRTIQGDGRERDVLERADIARADGVAALTSSDDMNLVMARVAKKIFNVPNVVARVYDPRHQEAFLEAGLQTVVSSSWSAHRIEQLLTHPGLRELASLGHHDVSFIEVQVPDHMVGKPAEVLDLEGICRPSAIVRSGHAELVNGSTELERGDLLVLSVNHDALPRLEAVLEGGD
jgi:trk system potassium uptake protein TrkA